MMKTLPTATSLIGILLILFACSDQIQQNEHCQPGSKGCACDEDSLCEEELYCSENICVMESSDLEDDSEEINETNEEPESEEGEESEQAVESEAHVKSDSDADSDSDGDAHSDSDDDGDAHSDSDSGIDSEIDTDVDSPFDTEIEDGMETDEDETTDVETELNSDKDIDTHDDSDTDDNANSTENTDADTGNDTGDDVFTGSGVEFVGNIPTWGSVRDDFLDYWDQLTPENAGKWDACEGTRDMMNWSRMEPMYNFAKENNIPFKQHTFVWGVQSPSWVYNLPGSEVAEEIEEWIAAYCEKFPETDMIDVVNEPVHEPATYAQNAFGDDWVIRVFEIAHQYCPNAILILNDYNVLRWDTDKFLAYAQPVMDAGLLDGIGCQAHSLHDQQFEELEANLQKIADVGTRVYISEYDLEIADDNQQRAVMEQQFALFYEHPSVVGITLWGYIVGRTWRNNTGLKHESGAHRPALDWLMDYIGR